MCNPSEWTTEPKNPNEIKNARMITKRFFIEEHKLEIQDEVLHSELAIKGYIDIIKSCGLSIVSDIDISRDFNIDANKSFTTISARIINCPNINIKVSNNTKSIKIALLNNDTETKIGN